MKAVILAAGVGSRLRPITNEVPKCLVEVSGKSILAYQLEAYKKAGIKEIIIVTGYLHCKIEEYLKNNFTDMNITIIENKDYKNTNNMYSLYLAKNKINDGFCMSNADVVFSEDMVELLLANEKESCIVVDKGNYNDESMKIIVENNRIINISKKVLKSNSFGASIDLYKFNKEAKKIMYEVVDEFIEEKKDLNQWTEVAIDLILAKTKFIPVEIGDRFWYEIDNHQDLEKAKAVVRESK